MPIYMKVDSIAGDTTASHYAGWFDISSFSWGVSNTRSNTGSGAGAGRATFQDISCTKPATGKGSPALMLACATGRHFATAELVVTVPNSEQSAEYLHFVLSDCIMTGYQVGGDGLLPSDSFSLNFTKIDYKQSVFNSDGVASIEEAMFDLRH